MRELWVVQLHDGESGVRVRRRFDGLRRHYRRFLRTANIGAHTATDTVANACTAADCLLRVLQLCDIAIRLRCADAGRSMRCGVRFYGNRVGGRKRRRDVLLVAMFECAAHSVSHTGADACAYAGAHALPDAVANASTALSRRRVSVQRRPGVHQQHRRTRQLLPVSRLRLAAVHVPLGWRRDSVRIWLVDVHERRQHKLHLRSPSTVLHVHRRPDVGSLHTGVLGHVSVQPQRAVQHEQRRAGRVFDTLTGWPAYMHVHRQRNRRTVCRRLIGVHNESGRLHVRAARAIVHVQRRSQRVHLLGADVHAVGADQRRMLERQQQRRLPDGLVHVSVHGRQPGSVSVHARQWQQLSRGRHAELLVRPMSNVPVPARPCAGLFRAHLDPWHVRRGWALHVCV